MHPFSNPWKERGGGGGGEGGRKAAFGTNGLKGTVIKNVKKFYAKYFP